MDTNTITLNQILVLREYRARLMLTVGNWQAFDVLDEMIEELQMVHRHTAMIVGDETRCTCGARLDN